MVPAHLLRLALPLTPNGKLDRKALPLPDLEARRPTIRPGQRIERIAAIWQDVLKLERIGARDNFFELGGDSIISLQVVSRARQRDSLHAQAAVPAPDRAGPGRGGQPRRQACKWRRAGSKADGAAADPPVFFDEVQVERHHWNQSVLLKPQQPLDAERLEQALAVLEHHDALRLGFVEAQGQWQRPTMACRPTACCGAARWPMPPRWRRWAVKPRPAWTWPAARCCGRCWPVPGEQRLLVIHHLAVDGVSWRILFEDLQQAYEQGAQTQLPARTNSVRDWAGNCRTTPEVKPRATGLLASATARCRHRPAVRTPRRQPGQPARPFGGYPAFAGNHPQAAAKAPAAYRTQVNDLLLCALARVIGRWSGRDDTLIQLEGHGREALFDALDLTRTVGWFTSLFPVRLGRCEALGSNLRLVKEQLRAIPDKGLGWGRCATWATKACRPSWQRCRCRASPSTTWASSTAVLRPRTARCSCRPARPWARTRARGGAGQLADAQWPGVRRRVQHGLALQHADVRRSHRATPGG
jgi:hypothetical protein